MKKLTMILVLVGFAVGFVHAGEPLDAEQTAVKKVIEDAYVDGLCNSGDIAKIRKGFHEGFVLLGVRNNVLTLLPIFNWIEYVKMDAKKGKYPAKDKVSLNYLFIDVTGTAAVAKVAFMKGGKHVYTDYLSLYKFDAGWRLVNKIYHKHPENNPLKK